MSKICQFNHCTLEAAFLYQLLSHPPLVPRKAIPCAKRQIQLGWYPGRPSPVPNARYNLVGTPEECFLYRWRALVHSLHRKAFRRTFFCPVITSWCPGPPGVRNRPHLKPHPPDSDRVALPGAVIFAHLSVIDLFWNGMPGLRVVVPSTFCGGQQLSKR